MHYQNKSFSRDAIQYGIFKFSIICYTTKKLKVSFQGMNMHILAFFIGFFYMKVMLGVDRLDMIKGIPQKILAFEKFLEENPDWHDKVVLLQIAVPTRTDVPECMLSIILRVKCKK